MKINITAIYRIETMNSTYEIKVIDHDGETYSSCKKMGADNKAKQVKVKGLDYLERLTIGASFDVPGVVTTSVVQDYQHFTLSNEPKKTLKDRQSESISGFFGDLTDHLIREVKGGAVMVEPQARVYKGYGPGCSELNHVGSCSCDLPPACKVAGCTYSSKYGPSHEGSRMCKSGSIASGGTRAHCACDYCY